MGSLCHKVSVLSGWCLLAIVFWLVTLAADDTELLLQNRQAALAISFQEPDLSASSEPEMLQLRRELLNYYNAELTDLQSAVVLLEELLYRADRLGDPELVYEFLGALNRLLGYVSDVGRSLEILQEYQAKYQARWSSLYVANMKLREIHLLLDLGQIDKATQMFDELEPENLPSGLQPEAYLIRSRMYQRSGDFTSALHMNRRALEEQLHVEDTALILRLHFSKGALLYQLGESELALDEYLRAESYVSGPYRLLQQRAIDLNLGAAYSSLDLFEQGLERLSRAVSVAEQFNDTLTTMQSLVNMANLYSRSGAYDQALDTYEKVLELAELQQSLVGMMITRMNMGTLYLDIADLSRAEKELQLALDLSLELEAVNEFNHIVQIMSRLYDEIGDIEQVVLFLNRQIEHQRYLLERRQERLVSDLKREHALDLAERELENVRLAAVSARRTMTAVLMVLLMATVFVVSYLFQKNKNLSLLFERNLELLNTLYAPVDKDYEHEAEVEDDPLKRLYFRVKQAMEQDKLYKNPELTVGMLAQHVSSNVKYTSNALSVHGKKTFNKYVNFYRINEAKRLLLKKGNNITIDSVLESCGYRSRATFYRAFNEYAGMTPKEFVAYSQKSRTVLG